MAATRFWRLGSLNGVNDLEAARFVSVQQCRNGPAWPPTALGIGTASRAATATCPAHLLGGSILLALLMRLLLSGFKNHSGGGENLLCRLLRDAGSS